jgi:hypothetical protein
MANYPEVSGLIAREKLPIFIGILERQQEHGLQIKTNPEASGIRS